MKKVQGVCLNSSYILIIHLLNFLIVSYSNPFQAIYCKTTQTDDEKFSFGEFSLGSQEFDYDDDMLPSHKHAIAFDE